MINSRFLILVGIIFSLALSRLVPHPWNFTPVMAMALFGGAYFTSRKAAFAVPLTAMVMSDMLLGCFRYKVDAFFFWVLPFTLGCFALTVALGIWLKPQKSVLRLGGTTLAASLLFFVVTNFGVWLTGLWFTEAMYPMDGTGLVTCYAMAIPFFKGTLVGNFLYAGILFGGMALAESKLPAMAGNSLPQSAEN